MSLRLIVNIGDKDKDDLEIEFWPDRKKAQAREITRQGVVHVDHEMNMQKVVDGLLGAIKESREERGMLTKKENDQACDNMVAFTREKMRDEGPPRCTCDDHCDSPCPVHARENELQNERDDLRQQLLVTQQALETERASHASGVAGLKYELKKHHAIAKAARNRIETYQEGELRTKRDSHDEWTTLEDALQAAGYKWEGR